MDITPLIDANAKVIQDYRNGRFVISGEAYEGAILLAPDAVLAWSGKWEDAAAFMAQRGARILLCGLGKTLTFPSQSERDFLTKHKIAADFMATDAACRTWQVLLSEGRNACAALRPYNDA